MYRGGRGGGAHRNRGGASNYRGGRNNGRSTTQRGLFKDRIWHCDCTPRLPAEHFKVKKEGKNQGRWFYTCQQHEAQRCGFFLWDEDAKPREEAAVLGNSHSEPRRDSIQDGWNAGRARPEEQRGKGLFSKLQAADAADDESTESPSPKSSSETFKATQNGAKRSAQDADLDADDDWALSDSFEEEISKAADSLETQTPRKAQKTGIYATPATTGKRKLPWLEQPTTPATASKQSSYFDTPSKQPSGTNNLSFEPETLNAPQTSAAGAATPSPPTRHKDALVNPGDSNATLTNDVLAALSSIRIPEDIMSNLRSILTRHDLKTQGVTKGRDISRLALKAKNAKITELHARVASLEAEREVETGLRKLRRGKASENSGG